MASKCISKLPWSRPPSASPNSFDHSLLGYLLTCTSMASKFAQVRPPASHDHGPQVHLQTRCITASKCITKLERFQPPSSHGHGLQVHLQSRLITVSKRISKLTRAWPRRAYPSSHGHSAAKQCRLKATQPIINTPPHPSCHLNGIHMK